ncbi:MAG: hypothetical protein R3325_02540 [Thermoanaerobaculia bacterium]|nr:hypothetical protein [Thermoanaerobaculia bacterium]
MRHSPRWLGAAAALTAALVTPPALACPSGAPPLGVEDGDLGPAPPPPWVDLGCLEVANDTVVERREIAWGPAPLSRAAGLLSTEGLTIIAPGGRRIAAQFEPLARWGGPLDDATLPIRWLEVSFPARVAPAGASTYSLRLYPALALSADPLAAGVGPSAQGGGQLVVETGRAEILLDPANPALLAAIAVDPEGAGPRLPVYLHLPGAGPELLFRAGTTHRLATDRPGTVVVDPAGFAVERRGPVRVVVRLTGHLVAPGGVSRCTRSGLDYERLGFTVVASFHRGRRGVWLETVLRNECSDGWSGPWTDDAVELERFSWVLPWSGTGPVEVLYAGGGGVTSAAAGAVAVEQRKGGGTPWRRRARVTLEGSPVESAESFGRPLVAVAGPAAAMAATLPWMRYREPQGLAADPSGLSLRFVGEPLVLGEGKGIWGRAGIDFLAAATAAWPEAVEGARAAAARELERGLLVRPTRPTLAAAAVLPSLGDGSVTPFKTAYRALMTELHEQTVAPGGQWDRARTFGSQLWPDVQADPWAIDTIIDPADNNGAMNYWNPSGAELLEFLRSGEPRWAWDFALPQSWLQAHTAYLNLGELTHGNRAGFAVTSGGTGEGQWHRSAYGSDDYTYGMGLWLAYLLRPGPALRDRLRQAGATAVERYSVPEGGGRERWVSEVDLTRQVVQHLWLLADCAELVPGPAGVACHDRLAAVVAELSADNLAAGVLCQGDDPDDPCPLPQQFMQSSLIYPFLDRLYRNYGDALGALGRAVADAPWNLYRHGLAKAADGVSLDVGGAWAAAMECDLAAGGSEVAGCVAAPDSDGNLGMYDASKPQTVALLLMSDAHAPERGLCQIALQALADPALPEFWQQFLGNESGWWKGAAQMMQSVVFGVGLADVCAAPCAAPATVELTGGEVGGELAVEACDEIRAGPDYRVRAGGRLTLRAARVLLRDGFRVEGSAALTVESR